MLHSTPPVYIPDSNTTVYQAYVESELQLRSKSFKEDLNELVDTKSNEEIRAFIIKTFNAIEMDLINNLKKRYELPHIYLKNLNHKSSNDEPGQLSNIRGVDLSQIVVSEYPRVLELILQIDVDVPNNLNPDKNTPNSYGMYGEDWQITNENNCYSFLCSCENSTKLNEKLGLLGGNIKAIFPEAFVDELDELSNMFSVKTNLDQVKATNIPNALKNISAQNFILRQAVVKHFITKARDIELGNYPVSTQKRTSESDVEMAATSEEPKRKFVRRNATPTLFPSAPQSDVESSVFSPPNNTNG